jgi:hypothetical protein
MASLNPLRRFRSRLRPTKNSALVAYKLLNDLLFTLLVFFILALIAEGIIPGLVSTSLSLLRVVILIAATLALIFIAASRTGIELKKPLNKKMTALVIFVAIILFFNSLLKLNMFLNLFISLTAIVAGYYTYEIMAEEN